MDNQRLLIWVSFGLLVWMTYQAWVQDYGPQPTNAEPPAQTLPLPAADDVGAPALPTDSVDAPAIADAAPALDGVPVAETESSGSTIHVVTDVLDIEINTEGGTLQSASLLTYPVEKDQPNVLVRLLDPARSELGLIQTGLNSAGDGPKADHNAIYQTATSEYDLGSADELVVPLTWTDGQGITVEKTYRFTRGSYRIDITQQLTNDGSTDWRGADYAQILKRSRAPERSMFDVNSYSFDGPIYYDGKEYEKLDRDDLIDDGPLGINATSGWAGFIQRHFVTAVVPPGEREYVYNISIRDNIARSSMISTPSVVVSPGNGHTFQ